MKKLIFVITVLIAIVSACNKNSNKKTLTFVSPDRSVILASTQQELLDKINTSISLNNTTRINNIEFPKCNRGYYAIVSFKKEDGTVSNIIYSNFLFNLKAKTFNFKKTDQKKPNQNYQIPTCYKFWCSPDGNCSNFQVLINDPFGNPTLLCSCDECHLNGQQVQCPD